MDLYLAKPYFPINIPKIYLLLMGIVVFPAFRPVKILKASQHQQNGYFIRRL